MPQKKIQISTLNLLARLVCPRGSRVVVYDPEGRLTTGESHLFYLENNAAALTRRLGGSAPNDPIGINKPETAAATCVFNLSQEHLDIPTPGWLVEFDAFDEYPGMDSQTWSYINNPDGSPRWIYPSDLRRPRFLAFYNFSYWKANLYKWLVRLAFFLRLPSLVRNGSMLVHHMRPLHVETLTTTGPTRKKDYAIFTGTPGPNRKAVIAEGNGAHIQSFLKIALSDRSAKNIANEY